MPALAEDWTRAGFGLYVHWPFCAAKCPYCDFNSHLAGHIDHGRWARALVSELDRIGAQLPGRVLNSIYFGGGTPSLMHPDTVAQVIEAARRQWRFANDIEITLEANPGSVEAGRFADYREAGVNRISMGFQALDDRDLRRLGRIHSVAEARAAWKIATGLFERVSFDLIHGRQDQSLADWRAELTEALSMSPDHLSLYQLTIEPGTAFAARHAAGGLRGLPDDDQSADLYQLTQDLCDAAGLPAYEISNHARPGNESRHNLIYWRYGDWAGIGPGAHGRLTIAGQRHATECWPDPNLWLSAAERGNAERLREVLTGQVQAEEYVMFGMRLREGIDLTRFQSLSGKPLSPSAIERLGEMGMVSLRGRHLSATARGRPVLNAVIRELLAE